MNGSSTDYGGGLSEDLLRIYFDSDRTGGMTDIYFAERAQPTDAFGTPVVVTELSSSAFDGNSSMTGDELDIVFSSQRAGDCIYEATRSAITAPWGPVQKIDALCPGFRTTGPSLSSDGLRLYFNDIVALADPEGQVMFAERASRTSPWSAPVPVAGVDGSTAKGFVTVTEDELTIWYEQYVGVSKIQVFEAHRAARTDPFGPASRTMWMGPDSETDPAITRDGKTMLFMSDRTGGGDIYTMTRVCQ